MNPLANAKDSGNADVLYSDDADGKDAMAVESNILISCKVTNKHKRAVAVNCQDFLSMKEAGQCAEVEAEGHFAPHLLLDSWFSLVTEKLWFFFPIFITL